jgi:hypothetical protein
VPDSKILIDNILKHVTLVINFILVLLISYQILELHQNKNMAILIVVLIIFVYIGVLLLTQSRIRKGKDLFA